MSDFDAMVSNLAARLREGPEAVWSDEEFDRRALAAFAHQFEACDSYRGFCVRRGATPSDVTTWEDVPAVPATAFKYFDLVSGDGGVPEATFRTSGTSRGADTRGRHHVPRLELYRASCEGPFAAALLPEGRPLPFLSLVPHPADVPESSLSFMAGAVVERYASDAEWLVDARGEWTGDVQATFAQLRDRAESVVVVATALALVHLMERSAGSSLRLPEGSRVMETGGFKGARTSISREELHRGIAETTGVAPDHIVNEYGMTELLSQLYERVLTEGVSSAGWHVPPPWLRVRALDPTSLRPLAEGEEGILAFFDLANLGSICHVLTEDVGAVRGGRLRLRGRAPGAEPRGCSRAMDDLMSPAAER